MSKNDPIMQRMKENYEKRARTYLTRRTPVIMRLDGKAFHTYTRGLDKPFDEGLIEDMAETAKFLCQEIQGAKCSYVQSDEISILITDYDKLQTSAWFDYAVQKMTSVSASRASGRFNQLRLFRYLLGPKDLISKGCNDNTIGEHFVEGVDMNDDIPIDISSIIKYLPTKPLADFDSRVFNIPKDEVANYFHARQRDAVKNSVSMLAQSLYSHSELQNKNGSEMQEMCFQKGQNWNDLDYTKKRGSWIVKNTYINDMIVNENDGIWYQPENTDSMYPDKRGRALQFAESNDPDVGQDWCDIPIEKMRTKWESVETPMSFSNNKIFDQWLQ